MVIGSVERGEGPLLESETGRIPQAARLRDSRGAPRIAYRTRRRAGLRRQRGLVDAQFSGTLFAQDKLRHGPDRNAGGLRRLSRERFAHLHQRSRPHGHFNAPSRSQRRVQDRRVVSRIETQAHRHRRIRS